MKQKNTKRFPHHGIADKEHSPKPRYIGTDYFAFFCPKCNAFMNVIKIRQCKGGGDEGRLIFNCECYKCKYREAIKLHFGLKNVLVEECKHSPRRI